MCVCVCGGGGWRWKKKRFALSFRKSIFLFSRLTQAPERIPNLFQSGFRRQATGSKCFNSDFLAEPALGGLVEEVNDYVWQIAPSLGEFVCRSGYRFRLLEK